MQKIKNNCKGEKNKMELQEKIDKAKEIAKQDYNNTMKKLGTHNPNYIRAWREIKLEDGRLAFALEGTPDKAFVIVENDYTVTARRQDMSIIKSFKAE